MQGENRTAQLGQLLEMMGFAQAEIQRIKQALEQSTELGCDPRHASSSSLH